LCLFNPSSKKKRKKTLRAENMYHTHTHKDCAPVYVCVALLLFFSLLKWVSLLKVSLSLSTRFCVRLFRAEDKHGRTELAAFSNLFLFHGQENIESRWPM
jgi:hypothetical protein